MSVSECELEQGGTAAQGRNQTERHIPKIERCTQGTWGDRGEKRLARMHIPGKLMVSIEASLGEQVLGSGPAQKRKELAR